MAVDGQGKSCASLENGSCSPDWASAQGRDRHGDWAELTMGGVTQRLRCLPAGGFWMGSPVREPGRRQDESLRWVTVEAPFWLADTVCTQALWQTVTGQQPSRFRGEELPVEQVSWDAVTARFLSELNRRVPGLHATLPTEVQWEYACRAGTQTAFHWGDGPVPPDCAQHAACLPRQTVPVRTFTPNPWGLWQMHGNVQEWCEPADGSVLRSDLRVARGGSWNSSARQLRAACRDQHSRTAARHDLGFRLLVPFSDGSPILTDSPGVPS
jgi:formylglycine-generating enzyme required for sulfatase activity